MPKYQGQLSELLRPQQFGDLAIPQGDINRLARMVETGQIMNMVFHGKPGSGKTSAARIIKGQTECYEVNGSSIDATDFIKHRLAQFASSVSMLGRSKVCLIEEADGLKPPDQKFLPYWIERSWKNCRYIFTVNDKEKLIPAIRSRMQEICFDPHPAEGLEIAERLCARYESKLTELKVPYDPDRLRKLVYLHCPDFRSLANKIEYEFVLAA